LPSPTAAALAAACAAASGCYSYHVVPVEQLPIGSSVRVRVQATEAERIGALLGRDDRLLDGRLLARESDNSILLAVPTSVGADATGVGPLHQRVMLPRASLLEVEVRRLDKLKTVGVVAAVGAATATAAIAAFGGIKSPFGSGKGNTDR